MSYAEPPTDYTTLVAPAQASSQLVQGSGTGAYDTTTTVVTTTQASYAAHSACALSLLARLMGNSQQPLLLQDHRIVTNLLRLVSLSLAHGFTTRPAWGVDRVTAVILRYLGAAACSQSRHHHPILLPAVPLHS